MAIGQVKWFNNQKGYGFIETDESEHDVFVHYSEVEMLGYKTLATNSTVHFTLERNLRGPVARSVRLWTNADADMGMYNEEHMTPMYHGNNLGNGHANLPQHA